MNRSENVMSEFMLKFLNAINNVINGDFSEYAPLDEKTKLMLMNNGCRMSDDGQKAKSVCIDTEYAIEFIVGAMGNDRNTFFDFYYDAYRVKTLVVFLDYFKEIKTEEPPEFDENGIRDITGNSVFFFAIKQITERFMISYFNPATMTGDFNATVAGTNFRYLPCIIAGFILNFFKPLTEDDTDGCGIEHVMLVGIISDETISINDKLIGIRMTDA